jgi:ribosomal protein L34E
MKKKSESWECSNCGSLLGEISPGREVIRIKYKDLYLAIFGGALQLLCRRCGQENYLEDEDWKAFQNWKQNRGKEVS